MIQEAFFEFERLLKLGEPTGKADFAFHREIASATNNPFYVEMLDALGDRTIPCDVTSPWYTVEVLSAEYQTGLQREHLADPQGHFGRRSRGGARRHARASDRGQERYRKRLTSQQAEYLAADRASQADLDQRNRHDMHAHIDYSSRYAIDPQPPRPWAPTNCATISTSATCSSRAGST